MSKVELKRLVGKRVNPANGVLQTVGWNMDQLFLDGRQIAVINQRPGAAIGLFPGVELTPSQRKAVEAAIAAERGGLKPSKIGSPIELPYELLDSEPDDEGEEGTDVDDE